MITGKQIAITGGSGYLGNRLAYRLSTENKVRILDIHPPAIRERNISNIEYSKCDITNTCETVSMLKNIEIVFHRAGLFGNINSMTEPDKYYETNIQGTLSVIRACVECRVKRIIFDSTEFTYGSLGENPLTEGLLSVPRSMYGATKLVAENIIRYYDRSYNISSVILRFCRIRDRYKNDVITKLARSIRDKKAVELFDDGAPAMDYIDLEDAEDAVIIAASSKVRDTIINISSGTMMSLLDIVRNLAEIMAYPMPVISSRNPVLEPPSVEYLFGPKSLCLDISKANILLDWRPKKSMKDMITETALSVLQEK